MSLLDAKKATVNDLTSIVVKKKKVTPDDNAVKRKADEDSGSLTTEKKAKLEP